MIGILVNKEGVFIHHFFCRVNYDKQNWVLLAEQLLRNHTAIHVINRAQIMDDALNLAKSDLLDYEAALSVTEYLHKEMEYVPWASALTGQFNRATLLLSLLQDNITKIWPFYTQVIQKKNLLERFYFPFRSVLYQQNAEEDSRIWRL